MTSWGWLAVAASIGLVAGFGGAVLMLARARRGGLPVDLPDPRRLHAAPTPRGGGLGIIVAGFVASLLGYHVAIPTERDVLLIVVLAWALPNGIIGTIDDHQEL